MYEEIKKILKQSKKLVFFTGAGMSTESGIPDFRSSDGLYAEKVFMDYPPEVILSKSFFVRYPEIFYKFYFDKIIYRDAKPNSGHRIIAGFEKEGCSVTVVTQNIDGLHEDAGSTDVIELHGSVFRNICMKCGQKYTLDYICGNEPEIPICKSCGGVIRPDVTLYEEALDEKVLLKAIKKISEADILFAIGSSLTVYPAAGLLEYFSGSAMVIINKTTTGLDNIADYIIRDSCGTVLKRIKGG